MMWVIAGVFLLTLLSICALLLRVVRARNKRRLLAGMRGPASDAPGGVGISVLCSGADLAQVENLLKAEYAHYEVIVVLDAVRHPAEFAALAARYRMIRVEWDAFHDLPVTGVRALGRSRQRCYRRLVLIDRVQDSPAGDFDAAAAVATYDYLLPMRKGQCLLRDTIGRLVMELAEEPEGKIRLVRSKVWEPTLLLSREAVVSAGGFRKNPARSIPLSARRTLWEPLLCGMRPRPNAPLWLRVFGVLLLTVAFGAAVWSGRWFPAAALMTAGCAWAAAGYAAQVLREMAGADPCCRLPMRILRRN